MNQETEIATIQPQEIQPANLLQAIVHVATNPALNIDTLERMMAMQERLEARQRETAFIDALTQMQEELKPISKGGVNTFTKTRYARLEDIDVQIKPLLAKYGFSFSFDEESSDGKTTTFSAKLSHRAGHSEVKRRTLPTDVSATNSSGKNVRTAIQDAGSTTSYAIRYLIKMHLNIVEVNDDNDGNGPDKKISQDQARDLQCKLEESKANIPNFLKLIAGVERFSEIPERDFKRCMNAAEEKARNTK